jgi:predicted alpha-1,2-mannosidase
MMFRKYILTIFTCISTIYILESQTTNLFIGTGGHGHTYPGATVPFGMVQLSPDTDDTGWDWCSGYNYQDSTIMGFSHTHLSGTGISDLADILIMPYTGKVRLLPGQKEGSEDGYRSKFRHINEKAEPGYYSVLLEKHGIKAELTASQNAGYHRYTFPQSNDARIMIDLQHGLDRHRTWLTERVLDSELRIVDSVTLAGFRSSSGWANVQQLHFIIKFSKPFKSYGIAIHDVYRDLSTMGRGRNVKGVVTFDTKENEIIDLEVTISPDPIKIAGIKRMASFDTVSKKASNAWRDQLNLIEIEAPDDIKTVFMTALYHTALSPNKIKNPPVGSKNKAYDTEFTTLSQWDVYRAAFALNTIIRPEIVSGVLGTMMRAYQQNHYLPVWKLWKDEVNCMIGSPSVPMVSEAILKGFSHESKNKYYAAVKNSLTTDNPVAPSSIFEKYGYVPNDVGELFSVSKTLEMAYAHGCAAILVRKHFPMDKKKYDFHYTRSQYYKNVFDPGSGFFRGKNSKGQFTEPFDPNVTNENEFVEATPWQYLFHVQHDVDEMIAMMGGKEKFIKKLDALFLAEKGKIDDHILDITGLIGQYAHGNEPSHHVTYLYNYGGEPWKTQEKIHELCNRFYTNKPDGLCGNEDCGQMSAWYIFSALGFYPVDPSSGEYSLGKPMIKNARIKLPNSKIFEVRTTNFNTEYKYVKSVTFNGKRLTQPIIRHEDIIKGGVLEYELSDKAETSCYK